MKNRKRFRVRQCNRQTCFANAVRQSLTRRTGHWCSRPSSSADLQRGYEKECKLDDYVSDAATRMLPLAEASPRPLGQTEEFPAIRGTKSFTG